MQKCNWVGCVKSLDKTFLVNEIRSKTVQFHMWFWWPTFWQMNGFKIGDFLTESSYFKRLIPENTVQYSLKYLSTRFQLLFFAPILASTQIFQSNKTNWSQQPHNSKKSFQNMTKTVFQSAKTQLDCL